MMVVRPGSLPLRSPPAGPRGSSPGRAGGPGAGRGRRTPPRSPDKPQRSRGSSPGSGGRGPAPSLPRSRGSDTSISDRLDQSIFSNAKTHAMSPEDNINVVVRVRPLSTKEVKNRDESVVQFPGNGQIVLGPVDAGQKPRVFSYNVVFEPGATQDDVLQFSGIKRLIEMAVDGFSCTCFCYGQTGSGKTHTLTGPPGLFDRGPNPFSEDHGLVFRSFMYLFKLLQERKDFHFVLKASFLEIYNEKVIDLLNPGSARKPLAVRWSKKSRGFFVENLFTVDCEELDDLLAVLEEGMRNRSVGRHNMNDYSSRSHTILTVHITAEQQVGTEGVFITKQGKINFVDLAGSEMTKKTNSEGKTLEEANNINKSLMVLGYCIASLSDSKKKGGHIPYRDSKLTKLLADSLAGNGVTLMIACISPARSNCSETVNTLRYAARAKKIRTKPIVVMDPREALILSLKREVSALQSENDHLRTALHIHGDAGSPGGGDGEGGKATLGRLALRTPPQVDMDKLAELEGSELADLVRHYATENEALRRENAELFTTRELLLRDQEMVCRENERLLKKLEDVNSVCCRSPIIPARPTYSAEMLNMSLNGGPDFDINASTNVWTNPLNGSITSVLHNSANNALPGPKFKQEILEGRKSAKPPHRLPESIQKELDRRQIGTSMTNIADNYRERSHRRHNSWDNTKGGSASGGSADSTSGQQTHRFRETASDKVGEGHSPTLRRMSTAPDSISSPSLPKSCHYRGASPLSNHVTLNENTSTLSKQGSSTEVKTVAASSSHSDFKSPSEHFGSTESVVNYSNLQYSTTSQTSNSSLSVQDDTGAFAAQTHTKSKANENNISSCTRNDIKFSGGERINSTTSDSALLPLRSGPFPENEIPDSSPGYLQTSQNSRENVVSCTPKNNEGKPVVLTRDPFGSLVSLKPNTRENGDDVSCTQNNYENKPVLRRDPFGSLISLVNEVDMGTLSLPQSM